MKTPRLCLFCLGFLVAPFLVHGEALRAAPAAQASASFNNRDALLGPLGNYGGFTLTFPLLDGSPAIDAGDPLTAPPTDQRGVSRPQRAAPDIGAFERE